MRKPRDIDAELKALAEKQRTLKSRKTTQLGEMVVATGADALDIETLAGALLDASQRKPDEATLGMWRTAGVAFFRAQRKRGESAPSDASPGRAVGDGGGAQTNHDGA